MKIKLSEILKQVQKTKEPYILGNGCKIVLTYSTYPEEEMLEHLDDLEFYCDHGSLRKFGQNLYFQWTDHTAVGSLSNAINTFKTFYELIENDLDTKDTYPDLTKVVKDKLDETDVKAKILDDILNRIRI